MKYLIFFIVISFFISCSNDEIQIPDDVISKKEMAVVLTDIHIAQAGVNNRSQTDSLPFSVNEYVLQALKKNNLTKEEFLHSLKFYSANPEVLKEVYDSVVTTLSRMQGEMEK